ncbi:Uracil DNA glycosylase superfamily protein [Clostridium tertium]|uniref:Uracil DNA glycosylase superfamily protein n=1 Tax=Clostridium tertium TaxID=1559 RepID=A0A6N3F5J4_9CLOT
MGKECHYKKGKKRDITLVFSCPGRIEERKGEPAAGQTGSKLEKLLDILNKSISYSFVRDDVSITNSTKKVEYYAKTKRSEASKEEIIKKSNIQRLYNEVKGTENLIICFGNNAKIAIEEMLKQYGTEFKEVKVVNVIHLSMKSLNFTIKIDKNNKKIIKGRKGNTIKRLEVIAKDIEYQFKK